MRGKKIVERQRGIEIQKIEIEKQKKIETRILKKARKLEIEKNREKIEKRESRESRESRKQKIEEIEKIEKIQNIENRNVQLIFKDLRDVFTLIASAKESAAGKLPGVQVSLFILYILFYF